MSFSNRLFRASFVAVAALISACSPQSSEKQHAASVEEKIVTPEDWKVAFKSTFIESNLKKIGDGETQFDACFQQVENKCIVNLLGERDAFRKRYFIKNIKEVDIGYGAQISAYISIGENETPSLFLSPSLINKGWLFIEKISFLVNGEISFEREFYDIAKRDVWSAGTIYESAHFILKESEIEALNSIKSEDEVLVRLTGKEGVQSMSKERVSTFVADFKKIVYAHKKLNSSLENNIPPSSTEPPKPKKQSGLLN